MRGSLLIALLLAALWSALAGSTPAGPWKERGGMDPNGTPAPAPATSDSDSDARGSMDPNG